MPKGIEVTVADGFASIEFTDPKLRGPALGKLLAVGGPDSIDVDTGGTRRAYRVPEGNARAAGLIDTPKPPAKAAEPADDKPAPAAKTTRPRKPKPAP